MIQQYYNDSVLSGLESVVEIFMLMDILNFLLIIH